jgi:lysophospholipase L1-like esterase
VNAAAKTVLCYGDSLTWGYNAEGPSRHAYEDRWPTVLQRELGDGFLVIPEGLNGRTTAFDDHVGAADRNGLRLLPTLLTTHGPLDCLILFLGANDMKPWIAGRAVAAKQGMERLIEVARGHDYPMGAPAPAIVIVSPPPVCATEDRDFTEMFAGAVEESPKLAERYSDIAQQMGCAFFDAGGVAKTTPLDGIHLDAENTRAVGRALAPVVRQLLGS